ncbi:MAG TPA: energy transducer TonB [Lysobacter sp.]
MKLRIEWMAIAGLAILVAACTSPGHMRANRPLDTKDLDVQCQGDFDSAPVLVSGRSPVFPIGMLNPDVVENRKIRHLPMEWSVTTTFVVEADGRTADVRATPTSPQSFSDHTAIAVKSWRFTPATKGGGPVAVHCSNLFGYSLY